MVGHLRGRQLNPNKIEIYRAEVSRRLLKKKEDSEGIIEKLARNFSRNFSLDFLRFFLIFLLCYYFSDFFFSIFAFLLLHDDDIFILIIMNKFRRKWIFLNSEVNFCL